MKNLIRPREMELFAAVCRTGSVTQSAASIGLSQPAASTMLRELEDRLGVTLFLRQGRRLVLTADGRSLLPDITHALAALDSVEKLATSLGRKDRSRFTLGTVTAIGASVVPLALRELQIALPDLAVVLRVGTAAEVVEMAIQQRIDLGVILGSGAHEHVGFRSVAELGLVCVVRADHAWAHRKSVGLAELAATPYIAHSRHLPVGALTAQVIEETGQAYSPAIEVMQFSAACALTDAGCGPSILESVTGEYARKLGLVPIPLQTDGSLSLNLVWPLGKGLGRAANLVTDAIVRHLKT